MTLDEIEEASLAITQIKTALWSMAKEVPAGVISTSVGVLLPREVWMEAEREMDAYFQGVRKRLVHKYIDKRVHALRAFGIEVDLPAMLAKYGAAEVTT